jgi:uncharacterized protein (TIGR02001 family)
MTAHDSHGGTTHTRAAKPGYLPLWMVGLLAVWSGTSTGADDAWSASIAATSDYVLRGVSQSHERPALQAGFNYHGPGGAFAGAWTSNVDPYSYGGTALELDLYAGYAWSVARDFSLQSTYTHYTYLLDPRSNRYDYDEFAFTFKYLDRVSLTVSWEPDVSSYSSLGFAQHRSVLAYEASGLWPLGRGLALSAGIGYYDLERLFGVGYWAGSAGLSWTSRHFEIDLARYVSDHTVERLYESSSADGSVVLTGILRF